MNKAFQSAFQSAFSQAYGPYDISPYAILDVNLEALTDLLGNVIEEEF